MMVRAGGGGGGGGGASGFYRTVTIDHTKVGSSTSSNFPVLVRGTYAYLKTVANGGKVEDANGYDIGFFADAGLTTRLKHEIEKYDPATGEIVAWVKVPSVSHTVDTVIYMNYGDATITTDQSDAASVWDSDYLGVYHLGDGSSLSLADSTANARTLTNHGATAVAGQVSGGAAFVAASSQYAEIPTFAQAVVAMTITGWLYLTTSTPTDYAGILFNRGVGAANAVGLAIFTTRELLYTWTDDPGTYAWNSGQTAPAGAWVYVALTVNSTTAKIFLGAAGSLSHGTHTHSHAGQGFGTGPFLMARDEFSTRYLDCRLDEMRLAKIDRSDDWITAEYNNQYDPSTFYAVGSEVAA